MGDPVVVPGERELRASLDDPADAAAERSSDACVVACPPHPQLGGSRSDRRIRAVADALGDRGVACLRIDYGDWDEGRGETRDAASALAWAREHFETVALFGYSFGATVALVAAARAGETPETTVAAVSALAPAPRLEDAEIDAVAALAALSPPVQVCYGERDETVEWASVVERARERGFAVESFQSDHHFVGQHDAVGGVVASFLAAAVADS